MELLLMMVLAPVILLGGLILILNIVIYLADKYS